MKSTDDREQSKPSEKELLERILQMVLTQFCGFNFSTLTKEEMDLIKEFCRPRIEELEKADR